MDISQQIEELKQNILSGPISNGHESVDRLIELEGMKAMDFFQSIFSKDPFLEQESSFQIHRLAGYGVRQLMNLRAKESKSDFKFCPYCKEILNEYKIIDPFMIGLKCRNNHHFHIQIAGGECQNKNLRASKTKPIDIATEWLTDVKLRDEISNQVAEILRKYVELEATKGSGNEEINANTFCPVCGERLEKFKQDDVWVEGLRCSNGHILYSRHGLSFDNAQLKPDINKSTFDFLVKGYLEEQQSKYLPHQIVELLNEISEQ